MTRYGYTEVTETRKRRKRQKLIHGIQEPDRWYERIQKNLDTYWRAAYLRHTGKVR